MISTDSEKAVESHLVKRMREIGGRAYKWVSPGTGGVPDRICVFPGGRIEFVELKGKGGRESALQKHRFTELSKLRRPVWVLWSRGQVDLFMDIVGGEKDAVCPSPVPDILYQPDNK